MNDEHDHYHCHHHLFHLSITNIIITIITIITIIIIIITIIITTIITTTNIIILPSSPLSSSSLSSTSITKIEYHRRYHQLSLYHHQLRLIAMIILTSVNKFLYCRGSPGASCSAALMRDSMASPSFRG